MDAKLSVAGGSVRSVTTSDTAHHGQEPRAAHPRRRRGLRRLGLFQARSPAAGRGGARVAGASGRHTRRPAGPPRCCVPPSDRTHRPRSTPAPRPAHCREAPRSPSNPAARWSWPARRWPPSAPWSAPSSPTPRCSTTASPPTASPSLRPPRTRCGPRAGCSTFPATAPWSTASTGSAPGAAAGCAPPPRCRCASTRGRRPAIGRRWDAVHALGPVLVAAFANSPVLHGRRTGWKSSRLAAWLAARPAAHRPAASLVRRPGGRVGPPGARHRAAVRPARRRPVGRAARRHVRRLGPRRRRAARSADHRRTSSTTSPPCSRRSGRTGTSRSATSTPSPGGAGRCRRRCSPPCCPTRR